MQTMKEAKLGWSLGLVLVWSGAAFGADATAPAYQITKSSAQPDPQATANAAATPTATTAPTATPAPPPSGGAKRSAADLEKLVAPIALYPDPLLATVLPASVYPLEIVQAARFVADTNNLAKLDEQPWDKNVKDLARVPDALKKLNEDLNWTIELGEAFLAQDKDMMDAIQSMRNKAQQAGTLRTSEQQVVTVTNMVVETTVNQQAVVVTNTVVQIQPASTTTVYVPTYNPYTVYYPPPGYVYNPMAPLVSFGIAVGIGAIIHNNCDWHHGGCYYGDVDINVDRDVNRNVDRDRNVDRGNRAAQTSGQKKWQPDQNRLNKSGASASTANRDARGWSGGGSAAAATRPAQRPTTGNAAARPAQSPGAATPRPAAQPAARPTTTWQQPTGNRPSGSPGVTQPSVRQPSVQQPSVRQPSVQQPSVNRSGASPTPAARPSSSPSVNRSAGQSGSAFSGVNSGARANNYSSRGASSRGGGATRGGGGGARGGGGGRR